MTINGSTIPDTAFSKPKAMTLRSCGSGEHDACPSEIRYEFGANKGAVARVCSCECHNGR